MAVYYILSHITIRTVLCWAVGINLHGLTCIHIKCDKIVWASLPTCCFALLLVWRLMKITLLTSLCSIDFGWHTIWTIIHVHEEFLTSKPANVHLKNSIYCYSSGVIRVLSQTEDRYLRLCIFAHFSPSGHRAVKITKYARSSRFHKDTLHLDV